MKKKKSFRKSYRKKPIIPFYKKKGFWIIITLPVLILTIGYFLIFSRFFWINDIRLSGNENTSREDILELIDNEISVSFIFFKSRTIFLTSTSEITKKIISEFPEIKFVEVRRSFPDALTVIVRERMPVAIWCRDTHDCFFIDNQGVIFEKTLRSSGLVVIEGGDTEVSLSEKPLSSEDISILIEIWRELKDVVKLSRFRVNNPDINIRTTEGWDILFTFREPVSVQTERLILAMDDRIPVENRSMLEYIDARFENRIYFKYRDW